LFFCFFFVFLLFSNIPGSLNKKAKELKEYQDSRHNASVSQLRDFTKRLGGAQQEGTSVRIRIHSIEQIDRDM
jgi:hypothetical protein